MFWPQIKRKFRGFKKLWGTVVRGVHPVGSLLLHLPPERFPDIKLSKALTASEKNFSLKAPAGEYILRIQQVSAKGAVNLKILKVRIGKGGVLNRTIEI